MISLANYQAKEVTAMNKKRILPIIFAFVTSVLISVLLYFCMSFTADYPMEEMDQGWTVTINGKVHKDVQLTRFKSIIDGELKRGDNIVLSRTLPDLGDIPFPTILFKSRYTTLTVLVDDVEFFDFGQDMYNDKKFLGKTYHFITLPTDFDGKELKLIMKVSENDAFKDLNPPIIGSQPDVEGAFIHRHMPIISTGMFLMVFGIAFLCINLFFVSSMPEIRSFLLGSIFCMNVSAWVMCYYSILSPFIYTKYETQVEFFTMYLIVPYCYLFLYTVQKIENKKLYLTAALLTTGITLAQYVLHYIFNIHMKVTLPMYHIAGTFGFGVITYYLIKNIKRKDISESGMIQMLGMFAFALAQIIHLVIYYMASYTYIPNSSFLGVVALSAGCLLFVLCQLANYLLFITSAYAQRQEYASLSHLAYADGLTNLPNRARADKMLDDLDKTELDYCIISVDLNGLKTVNDEFGHPSGDKYIKDFSKVLSTTFNEAGFCARIGGDEFIVLIEDSSEKEVDALLGIMTSALNVMNALYSEYHRSVATGYAFRHECPENASSHEVYLLADQRMYELKRKMHEELGIHNRL